MYHTAKNHLARRTRLGLESLDSRIVPAVVLTQLDLDGDGVADDIRIVGDGQNTKIAVIDNGSNLVQFQIDANGDGDYADAKLGDLQQSFVFSGNSFVLDVQLKGGKDALNYVSTGGFNNGARTVTADLGSGNDSFFWAQNNLVQNGSRIKLDVIGGSGADKVTIDFAQFSQSLGSIRTDLGAGADTYDLTLGDIDQGSSLDVHTELGNGLNTHSVDIDSVGKFLKGTLDMTIVGGAQTDNVQVLVQDDVGSGNVPGTPSRLGIYADLLGGNDTFKGILNGGDFRVDNNSQASFVVRGGAGNDSLSMERAGTGPIRIDADGLCLLDFDGGTGKDTIKLDFGGVDAWHIEAGATLKIRMDGGLGNDVLSCLLTNDNGTVGNYDVAVYGGAGDDTMAFALNNNGGTPLYGPAGGFVLDGGAGKDTLANGNPAITFGTTFEVVI